MAQATTLYIDVFSGDLVAGPTNPTVISSFPKLIQGDTKSFNIYLLARTTSYPIGITPFTIINNASLSLKVAIGPKDGTAGSTLYTQQFTWTRDSLNQYFTGSLPLNTAAITTLLGSAATATAYFEIEFTEAGLPTTAFQRQVTIDAEVIETGSITTPPGQTAMTAEEANATFLKRDITGAIILANATTGAKMALYLGDDGAFHADPLT